MPLVEDTVIGIKTKPLFAEVGLLLLKRIAKIIDEIVFQLLHVAVLDFLIVIVSYLSYFQALLLSSTIKLGGVMLGGLHIDSNGEKRDLPRRYILSLAVDGIIKCLLIPSSLRLTHFRSITSVQCGERVFSLSHRSVYSLEVAYCLYLFTLAMQSCANFFWFSSSAIRHISRYSIFWILCSKYAIFLSFSHQSAVFSRVLFEETFGCFLKNFRVFEADVELSLSRCFVCFDLCFDFCPFLRFWIWRSKFSE